MTCAASNQACIQTRKTAETCYANCARACNGNKRCISQCESGCKTIRNGLLASCKKACPACQQKVRVCHTTCKATKQVNVCKKYCIKKKKLVSKFCFRPCKSYGFFKNCNHSYCPKYKYGKRLCVKQCKRYNTYATEWCKPKCKHVQCRQLCDLKSKQICVERKASCQTITCAKRGTKCTPVQVCLIQGKKACRTTTKCTKYKMGCANKPVCTRSTLRCTKDQCTKVCIEKTLRRQCHKKCTKSITLSKQQCSVPCLAKGVSQICDSEYCERYKKGPQVCKNECTRYKTVVKKVCVKDCGSQAPSYDAYQKLAIALQKSRKDQRTCAQKCYALNSVCMATAIKPCYGRFQKQVLACLKTCEIALVNTSAYQYSKCMAMCDSDHPLSMVLKCHDVKCGGLAGKSLKQCHRQCYARRGRCRCSCSPQKEYVCVGSACQCRARYNSFSPDAVSKAAAAVASAAEDTANSITRNPKHNSAQGESARSTAEAALKVASKFGARVSAGPMQESAAKVLAKAKAAAKEKSAKKETHAKKNGNEMTKLSKLMMGAAQPSANKAAEAHEGAGLKTQKSLTLAAAAAAAKQVSAAMVQHIVKQAAGVASQYVQSKDALTNRTMNASIKVAMKAAASAAVRRSMGPITKLVESVSSKATSVALSTFPAVELRPLTSKAKTDIFNTAFAAAEARAKRMVGNESKQGLLIDAQRVASAAVKGLVLNAVKEVAAKAATKSRTASSKANFAPQAVAAAAKREASLAAKQALKQSQVITKNASSAAVMAVLKSISPTRVQEEEIVVKASTKEATAKKVQKAAIAAQKEAAAKGKNPTKQAEAAEKAAAGALNKQKALQRHEQLPDVKVRVAEASPPSPSVSK